MSRKYTALAILVLILILSLLSYYYMYWAMPGQTKNIIVFSAGSLKIPLDRVAAKYEELYGTKVYIEASGSVEAIRKITDLGRQADVLAVADYRLIPRYLLPQYTDWYIGFASNELVLVYTNTSRYHIELENNPSRWFEILMKNDVRWGFSDPNKDPCGYRTVGLIGLASLYYNDSTVLFKLLIDNTNMRVLHDNGSITIVVPADLQVHSENLFIRSKSIDLISLLEAGTIDYAFEYRSVAVQHGLRYIELPKKINLGDPAYDKFYEKVSVKILSGTDKETTIHMSSIVYGITVLSNSPNHDEAVRFVAFLLGSNGREIFSESGQQFLDKPILYGNIPEEIIDAVKR